jgi:hypothetical protein
MFLKQCSLHCSDSDLHINYQLQSQRRLITLFRAIAVFCWTDSIMRSIPHVQYECEVYFVGMILFCGIFSTFGMNVGDILQNIVSPAKQCYVLNNVMLLGHGDNI